eukprot:TRINITY_DN5539_c0_g1_i1.p1 TRINITY_DN5539_c0_g1~~TRINITY_DN5539_c0_g1_i1.p1  ORF type:complete len:428 (-),score=76.73 TRINITY_DN5539_c0_g1_i1:414-1697(-)
MGKAKKLKVTKNQDKGELSLTDQMERGQFVVPTGRVKDRKKREEDSMDAYVEGNLSKSILQQARLQAAELEEEMGPSEKKIKETKLSIEEDDEELEDDDLDNQKYDDAVVEVNEDDDLAVKMFMSKSCEPRRTIADLIMEKINDKKTEIDTQFSDNTQVCKDLDPRVQQMYAEIGEILKKYRSGRIPKAFKVIAQFRNWEQLLALTKPEQWSAAAMYQAVRIFTSNLKEKLAQRFFNLILLPRIRDDIDFYKRLNFHLYQALRKALFKPGAFFKGFLLPLCEERNCTLREAIIIGSVLTKNSIPVLHSCAAMMKIAEMEYSGANSIFLRALMDKKYALPYRVIDSIVFHYLGFRSEKRELPVLWYQSFLTFAQRYKQDISSEQKQALLDLCKIQFHDTITPEIRRELEHSRCRDEETAEPPAALMEV